MDPVTAAATFTTLVGLLCNFKSEKRAQSDDEYRVFINWLEDTRQQQLLDEIQSNQNLAQAIKNLLEQNQQVVLDKIEQINNVLFKVASHLTDFKEITHALNKNLQLSEQAWSILQQLEQSKGSFFLESKMMRGPLFQIMDGNGGMLELDELRFIEDDLQTLTNLKLLIPDFNKNGNRLWRITREAANLIQVNNK